MNVALQISGVDAARTLLADLLSVTDAARGVGELALYWAARAKLEEVSFSLAVASVTLLSPLVAHLGQYALTVGLPARFVGYIRPP